MNRRILITGGFGFLGGRLARFLASQSGYEIFLGSRQKAERPHWLPQANVVRTQWDSLTGLQEICTDVDAVVHMAGMNAQDCAADPVAALEFNGGATARLLRAAVLQGVERFIYVSTAHVYSSPLIGMVTEETCPVSLHPYATSHRAGEDVVRGAHQRGEIEGVVIRLSNAYGAPVSMDVNCWMLLVNDLCRQAVSTRRLVLQSAGLQRRDFVTMTDACRGIHSLLRQPKEKLGAGLFNLGGEWAPTILEMSQRIADRCNAVLGFMPPIARPRSNDHGTLDLDYKMDRLKTLGYTTLGGIDAEIEATLKFCAGQVH